MRSDKAPASINAKKTECKWGHDLAEARVVMRLDKDGVRRPRRVCLICKKEWHQANPKKRKGNPNV